MYPSQKLSPSRWHFAKLRRHMLLSPLGTVAVEGDWPTASTTACVHWFAYCGATVGILRECYGEMALFPHGDLRKATASGAGVARSLVFSLNSR